jgi:hypothetical protein
VRGDKKKVRGVFFAENRPEIHQKKVTLYQIDKSQAVAFAPHRRRRRANYMTISLWAAGPTAAAASVGR